jgi:predicted ester cyclase
MTYQELRDFYLRYVDLLNAREFERLDEFVHDEVTQNGVPATREDMAAALREHTRAIPDLVWDVQALVIEGNRIAARLRDTGTPEQEWFGLAPSGASVTFDECAFYEVRDGRLAHTWYLMDAEAVRRQLAG